MILNLQEVARAIQASGEVRPIPVTGWSVDTRTQSAGDLYFALRGANYDGHDFVVSAIEKGAAGVVVDANRDLPLQALGSQLDVADPLRALQDLGAWARRRWGGRVVGVTGSAGKTTTKDAIAHLVGIELAVGRTIGNFNNHVGVPLSILRLPGQCRVAVLEMGMNHAGEIRQLAGIAKPNIGVVTNVGYAHVEFFESIDGVAAAKRELIEALPGDGVAVLNADDPRVRGFRDIHTGRTVTFGFAEDADVRAEAIEANGETTNGAGLTRFRASGVDFETTLSGRHGVMNLLAAIAVAGVFDIAPERLRDPVRSFSAGRMRGERTEHRGVVIWNDCYNSNPEASQSMIDVLKATPARRRFAVLGEMLELGRASEELHRLVGRYAVDHGVDFLIGVHGQASAMVDEAVRAGLPENAARFFEDANEAGDFLRTVTRAGDAVLFKASRGVRVERALERFMA
jgi:UDP-N-acetylmuramoyl-tripeptide--D-alanyl-D-alanine ligase